MQVFRVALLQMTAGSSQEENQRKGLDWCRRAKAMGADLALFPEMWNTGYAMTEDEQALRQNAVGRDSGFVRAFQEAAKELDKIKEGETKKDEPAAEPTDPDILSGTSRCPATR